MSFLDATCGAECREVLAMRAQEQGLTNPREAKAMGGHGAWRVVGTPKSTHSRMDVAGEWPERAVWLCLDISWRGKES